MRHFDPLKLDQYLDDEVTQEEKIRIDQHLRVCDECRKVVDELSSVRELLKGLPIYAPKKEERRRFSFKRVASYAILLLIAFLLSLFVFHQGRKRNYSRAAEKIEAQFYREELKEIEKLLKKVEGKEEIPLARKKKAFLLARKKEVMNILTGEKEKRNW